MARAVLGVLLALGAALAGACSNEAPSEEELAAEKAADAADRQGRFDQLRAEYGVHWTCTCSGYAFGRLETMTTTICAASQQTAKDDARALIAGLPNGYEGWACTSCCYEGEKLLQKAMCKREIQESCEQSDPTTVRCPSPGDMACGS